MTASALIPCNPAPPGIGTAYSPAFHSFDNIPRDTLMVPALAPGAVNATDSPVAGSTAACG